MRGIVLREDICVSVEIHDQNKGDGDRMSKSKVFDFEVNRIKVGVVIGELLQGTL